MLTVADIVVVAPSATVDPGARLQLEFAGSPVQVSVATPGTLAAELSSSGNTALLPLDTLTVVPPSAVRVKSTPVPLRAIACGELGALSETLNTPDRGPPAVGKNITCNVHADPAWSVVPLPPHVPPEEIENLPSSRSFPAPAEPHRYL